MRTKTLKINGQEKEAMLMAGGYGAKVYAVGADLVLTVGKKNFILEESNPAYKITMKFVNLKYQPISEHEYIKLSFQELVSGLNKQKNPKKGKTMKKYLYEVEYERSTYGGKKTKEKTKLFATSPEDINTYRLGGFQRDSIKIIKTKKIRERQPIEVECDIKRNELTFSISVDEHIHQTLERAHDIEKAVNEIEEQDGDDINEALEALGYEEVSADNTYNYGSDFEDEINFHVFMPKGQSKREWYYSDEAIITVYVHTGLDVRGGYKFKGIYKGLDYDYFTYFLDMHVRLSVMDKDNNEIESFDGDGAAYQLLKEYKLVSCKNGNIKVKKDGKTYDVSYYHPVYGV